MSAGYPWPRMSGTGRRWSRPAAVAGLVLALLLVALPTLPDGRLLPGTPSGDRAVAAGGITGPSAANFSESTLVLSNDSVVGGNYLAVNGIFPGPVAYDARNGYVYTGNAGGSSPTSSVSVINASTGDLLENLALPSQPLAITAFPATGDVFVACGSDFGTNAVAEINESANRIVREVAVGMNPDALAIDPARDQIFVANRDAGNVSVINVSSGGIAATVKAGNGSVALGLDPTTGDVYVANSYDNTVGIFNSTTDKMVARVAVGSGPSAVAFDPQNGTAYIENAYSSNVSVINATTHRVTATIKVSTGGGAQSLLFDPATSVLYLAEAYSNRLALISPSNNSVFGAVIVGSSPYWIALNPYDGDLYAVNKASANVSVVAPANNTVVASVAAPGGSAGIAIDNQSGRVFVTEAQTDSVTEIDATTHTYAGQVRTGVEPQFVVYDRATNDLYVTEIDADAVLPINASSHREGAAIAVGSSPRAEALDPATQTLWVDNVGSNNVTAINLSSGRVIANVGVGSDPTTMQWNGYNRELYVANYYSANVSVINGTTDRLQATVPVGSYPSSLAVDPANGEVFSMSSWYKNVTAISASSNTVVANFGVGGYYPIELQFDPVHAYLDVLTLSPNAVQVVAPGNHSVVATIPIGYSSAATNGLGFDPSTGDLYVPYVGINFNGTVAVVNGSSNRVITNVTVGTLPGRVFADPLRGVVYIQNAYSNDLSVLSATTHRVLATIPAGASETVMAEDPTTGVVYFGNLGEGTMTLLQNGTAYPLNLTESGLPSGTNWSASVDGLTETTNQSTLEFRVTNGSHRFAVASLAGFVPVPSNGTVVVNGTAVTTAIAFVVAYPVDFNETGLPTGTGWQAALNGSLGRSTTASIGFEAANGSYPYRVDPIAGWRTGTYAGTVNVTGGPVTVAVPWSQVVYPVVFNETGLPAGTNWSVDLGSLSGASVGPTVSFQIANGSYPYTIGGVPGWWASSYSGTVTVDGSGVHVTVAWVNATYTLTFEAAGLATGTVWSVTVNGTNLSGGTSSLSTRVPNGTYLYAVGPVSGYFPAAYQGSVRVIGSDANVSVNWSRVVYGVRFSEAGLPVGTTWAVWFNGSWTASSAATIRFERPNGTANYSVRALSGWHADAYAGTVDVTGTNASVTVVWTQVLYPVAFTAVGLPNGTAWNVSLGARLASSTTGTLTFTDPNGTFPFEIMPTAGRLPHPSSGNVTVRGMGETLTVVFAPPPNYTITFEETGLSPGTPWGVTLAGAALGTTGSSLSVLRPNGSYPFTIAPVGNRTAAPAGGTVSVQGGNRSIAVAFVAPSLYEVRFVVSGLASRASWTVTLASDTATETGGSAAFAEANGTYPYAVGGIPGYRLPRYGGDLTVLGGPVTVDLNWTRTTYTLEFAWQGPAAGSYVLGGTWSVAVGNLTVTGPAGTSLRLVLPNGTYAFAVSPPPGLEVAANATGSVTVDAANVSVAVDLTPSAPGASTGSPWSTLDLALVALPILVAVGALAAVIGRRRKRRQADPAAAEPSGPVGDGEAPSPGDES